MASITLQHTTHHSKIDSQIEKLILHEGVSTKHQAPCIETPYVFASLVTDLAVHHKSKYLARP